MEIGYLADHSHFIPTLSKWHHDQWSYLNPSRTIEDRVEELQLSASRQQIPITFVAFSGGVLLGSASLIAHDMDTRLDLSPWLASVYVAPRHRKKGFGSALVKRTVKEAKASAVETLYLFTPDREDFYARLGWSFLERTGYHGENVVIMSLRTTVCENA